MKWSNNPTIELASVVVFAHDDEEGREGAKAAATEAEAERRSISRDSFLRIGFRDGGVRPTRRPLLLGWPVAVGLPVLVSVSRWIEGVVQKAVR